MADACAICFTSNGVLKNDNALVMGAGVARAFRNMFPTLDKTMGYLVRENGNICQMVAYQVTLPVIVAFPTKHHWRNPSDLELIKKSAVELMDLVEKHNWKKVYITRAGCGMGQLSWVTVKPILEKIFDDRIIVCYL